MSLIIYNYKYNFLYKQAYYFETILSKFIDKINIFSYYHELKVIESKFLLDLCFFFINHSLFQLKVLVDLIIVDYPEYAHRFDVTYVLSSIQFNSRILVTFEIFDKEHLPSICYYYSSANWLEREVWDLFGIFFIKHPDLRRILTDYGFIGFPLRKDFPLSGYFEIFYDDTKKRIVTDIVSLAQEYRNFYFINNWYDKEELEEFKKY